MKKTMLLLLAVTIFTAAGCGKPEESRNQAATRYALRPLSLPDRAPAATVPPHAQAVIGGVGTAATDPHAGLRMGQAQALPWRSGKVLQVIEAGRYHYLEVEEKGKQVWVAALKVDVAKGDSVEFPDSLPIENFRSKTLGRTFGQILFVETLKVVK